MSCRLHHKKTITKAFNHILIPNVAVEVPPFFFCLWPWSTGGWAGSYWWSLITIAMHLRTDGTADLQWKPKANNTGCRATDKEDACCRSWCYSAENIPAKNLAKEREGGWTGAKVISLPLGFPSRISLGCIEQAIAASALSCSEETELIFHTCNSRQSCKRPLW